MYFHLDCGHIINEEQDSMLVSEGSWRHYDFMYLASCPYCDSKYAYMNHLDRSVSDELQTLIFRLLETGYRVRIPPYNKKTKSIRIENVRKNDLGIEIDKSIVENIDEYEKDVLLKIST